MWQILQTSALGIQRKRKLIWQANLPRRQGKNREEEIQAVERSC